MTQVTFSMYHDDEVESPSVVTAGGISSLTGQDSASPIRNTHTGQVRGSLVHVKDTKSDVHAFLGIPFAKPPVGPLRFAPPENPEPWSGVRDGTAQPAV